VPTGNAEHNAEVFIDLLQGRLGGALLEMVCANAGAALDCWFDRAVLGDGHGVQMAREVIRAGSAWKTFVAYREIVRQAVATG
jgi:anthranilate phosphoribosyltransferase